MLHTEVTADIMRDFIAAYPTLSEAIHEAVLQADRTCCACVNSMVEKERVLYKTCSFLLYDRILKQFDIDM